MCSFQGTRVIIQGSAVNSLHRSRIRKTSFFESRIFCEYPNKNVSVSAYEQAQRSAIIIFASALKLSNGDKEIRTPDPLLARQVLSQLSYTPMSLHNKYEIT